MNIQVIDYDTVKVSGRKARISPEQGSNRLCFITGKYIIKVETRSERNHNDLEFYQSVDKRDRKYFVPTLEAGENEDFMWSVQPFLKGLTAGGPERARKIVQRLIDKYHLVDVESGANNSFSWNWGMYQGQPVIYDYGL